MTRIARRIGSAAALTLATLLAVASAFAEPGVRHRFVTIGTGSPSGVYHLVGNAICAAVNRRAAEQSRKGATLVTRCRAGPSGGSVFNLRQVSSGAFTFVIAQADVIGEAISGASTQFVPRRENLRAVMSLHEEALHIVVGDGSPIKEMRDLAGRPVGPGNPGSGTRVLARTVAFAHGLSQDDFDDVRLLTAESQRDALCGGTLSAFALVSAVPAPTVSEAVDRCGARVLALDGEPEASLLDGNPLLTRVELPSGAYATVDAPLGTIGVRAALATRAAVPDVVVRDVAEAVMQHLDVLRDVHPALADLEPSRMATEGLGAPLHAGAESYYASRGWR